MFKYFIRYLNLNTEDFWYLKHRKLPAVKGWGQLSWPDKLIHVCQCETSSVFSIKQTKKPYPSSSVCDKRYHPPALPFRGIVSFPVSYDSYSI